MKDEIEIDDFEVVYCETYDQHIKVYNEMLLTRDFVQCRPFLFDVFKRFQGSIYHRFMVKDYQQEYILFEKHQAQEKNRLDYERILFERQEEEDLLNIFIDESENMKQWKEWEKEILERIGWYLVMYKKVKFDSFKRLLYDPNPQEYFDEAYYAIKQVPSHSQKIIVIIIEILEWRGMEASHWYDLILFTDQ
jgi:competence CoiA-like predicted nuclease